MDKNEKISDLTILLLDLNNILIFIETKTKSRSEVMELLQNLKDNIYQFKNDKEIKKILIKIKYALNEK